MVEIPTFEVGERDGLQQPQRRFGLSRSCDGEKDNVRCDEEREESLHFLLLHWPDGFSHQESQESPDFVPVAAIVPAPPLRIDNLTSRPDAMSSHPDSVSSRTILAICRGCQTHR